MNGGIYAFAKDPKSSLNGASVLSLLCMAWACPADVCMMYDVGRTWSSECCGLEEGTVDCL